MNHIIAHEAEVQKQRSQYYSAEYIEATKRVLQRHSGLWFQDESFVIVRIAKGS